MRLFFFLIALALAAACGRAGPPPTPSPTAMAATPTPVVLAATAAPPTAPAATPTSAASPTAAAPTPEATTVPTDVTPGGQTPTAQAFDDPLLRAYRVMVSIQLNAALLAETAEHVQSGELEDDDTAVAILGLAAISQSIDEAVPGVTPPPEIAVAWQQAVAAHEALKDIGALWLVGGLEAAQVVEAVQPVLADLDAALQAGDQALAAAYNVGPEAVREYREDVVAALEGLFDD